MAKFEELNQYIHDVMFKLVGSQNLSKYLFYATSENSPSDPLDNPDLSEEERFNLVYSKIYPYPKVPTADEEGSFLTVYFDNINHGSSFYWKGSTLVINVICHINQHRLEGKLRTYALMNEIDELFNNQQVLGIGKMQFERSRFFFVNDSFSGYRLEYKFVDFS